MWFKRFGDKIQEMNKKLALENQYVLIGLTSRVTNTNLSFLIL
jgi:hypothetical protein